MSSNVIYTTQLERTNLEAHVDLCAERYRTLKEELTKVDTRLDVIEVSVTQMREDNMRAFAELRTDMIRSQQNFNKIMIGTAGTILAGVLTVIVTLLMR